MNVYYLLVIIPDDCLYFVSLSHSGKGWPLNHHFVFDLLAVGAAVLVIVTLLLPKSIELKRLREPEKVQAQEDREKNEHCHVLQVEEEPAECQDSERTQQS